MTDGDDDDYYYNLDYLRQFLVGIGQSVYRMATGNNVRGLNLCGVVIRPEGLWDPPRP
jgi:hypothetical protein